MAYNTAKTDKTVTAPVPLSVFGSLCTEMSPSDLPEGVSPDCQDVVFVPGNVSSRQCLERVFVTPIPAGGPNTLVPTIPYGKSYVLPNGDIRNLYFDSNGMLWVEDPINTPGVRTLLVQSTPGCYAKSITAFGREYIAISDGLHGQEVPLQWDGIFLDRVTQDGPGNPPIVQSVALGSTVMAVSSAPPVVTVIEADPANPTGPGGQYTAINIFCSGAGVADAQAGLLLTLAGSSNALLDGPYPIATVYYNPGGESLIVCYASIAPGTAFGLGGTGTIGSGFTATRLNNTVNVTTTSPHFLQPGYQVQISGMPAQQVGGGIVSIVIDNEDNPGIATVTTSSAHGLLPQNFVTLTGIAGTNVGTGIAAASVAGDVLSVSTTTAHGLAPGALITIQGNSITGINTTFVVATVSSATAFQCAIVAADATGSGGTVTLNWPIPDTPTPNYYEVQSAPTTTTFQVQVNYADGSWTGGTVSFAWDGTFFVLAVQSATAFSYQQYGPDATTENVGTVTPFGQAAPGKHQCQVLFLTRQSAITAPSPPVTFIANGGQYVSVTNIPIGPPNIVARILAFTGAQGSYFFYIPVPAQVQGQLVSTATQINDNTTTSVLLDFSDNTLFAALSINTQGNNLPNQIVLDSALGFGYYDTRLVTYGQRNRILNLLNMAFDGGYLPSTPTIPTGWVPSNTGGSLATGHYGFGWSVAITPGGAQYGNLSQSFYEDAYGSPIGTANTAYRLRGWFQLSEIATDVIFTVAITSASTSFSSTAVILGSAMSLTGSWLEAAFSAKTPATIPTDMTLSLYATSGASTVTLLVDELSIIYAQTPYLETILYGSYGNNPEGMDGVSGKFGPVVDTHKVMGLSVLRDTLYLLTQDPGGRLHETNAGITEPAGWTIAEVASNCGLLSTFGLTQSQADDSSASGGEEWFSYASISGARIFSGEYPWKVSQEIQPDWNSINPAAAKTIWSLNDPVSRVVYFGLPTGSNTAPNLIYPMNYRELDSAYSIYSSPPIHTSFTGHLIATDNTRKWTRWNLAMNGAAIMYRGVGLQSPVFFNGNGQSPGTANGFGNVYTLSPTLLTDQDYGQVYPYYTTYFFVQHDAEVALQLGSMKMVAYGTLYAYGTGNLTIQALINSLSNPYQNLDAMTPLNEIIPMTPAQPAFDLEFTGLSATGQRIAYKLSVSPATGTDCSFSITKFFIALRSNARIPVRGSN